MIFKKAASGVSSPASDLVDLILNNDTSVEMDIKYGIPVYKINHKDFKSLEIMPYSLAREMSVYTLDPYSSSRFKDLEYEAIYYAIKEKERMEECKRDKENRGILQSVLNRILK